MRKAAILVPLVVALAIAAAVFLFGRLLPTAVPVQAPALVLRPLGSVAALPGWAEDSPAPALAAFLRSCVALNRLAADAPLGEGGREGFGRDWHAVCAQARALPAGPETARAFFEQSFVAVAISDGQRDTGLFTGYYEPELHGSLRPNARYRVPLLAPPTDLVSVDLGRFIPDLRGRRISGRVVDGKLLPYPARAQIEAGALGPAARPILWLDDPIQAFFLHIQGSGRVALDDGRVVRVGYAGQNGHPYTAIGRVLVQRGALPLEAVSMQSIRAWLAAHPDEAQAVMNTNPSYIFFRRLPPGDPELGPLGSQQVPLTPGRSLAVDRAFHGLGVPVWLDATRPDPDAEGQHRTLRRLLVAQDTGGAIKGPVRGDVFWGFGPEAEAIAGMMKNQGRMVLLLPRAVAAHLANEPVVAGH